MLDDSLRLSRPDDVYQALMDAQQAMSPADAERFRARLILRLANMVGYDDYVIAAIEETRAGLGGHNDD